ncbi:ABC transporter ATP-binding protein [Saccharomonospora sp. CUA-673]|uniref:ABC transporter ATP-binding protein n=1 Tax=Saccharomonospora sp. CUA-673 TaxID=1904969 RepID=UPI00095EB598|nr:ABC transporter ATP-binding protein [Saccharomonospora sp. CUA-673]OLT45513.1 ABC transporter ATP-binding protein [Saccharomonospora sp. CUA-673]
MTEVVADGLGVRAGDVWLFRGIDEHVRPGECLVLTGPNGSGKSTFLNLVHGTQEPAEGRVTVGGERPDERDRAFRRRVSVLLDDSDFFAELTPAQHLELLAGSFDVDLDIDALLTDAALDDRAGVAAGSLSAGQRRRLLLLGATARPFDVLLLDEPERALDADGRQWLTELITRATGDGAVIVLATHHPLLLDAADHVLDLAAAS